MSIYQALYEEVFTLLNHHLPPYLTYHTPEHTLYVVDKAEYISKKEHVNGHELLLIKIAALFHDIGFIEQNYSHEEKSCEIFLEKIKDYQFPQADLDKICGMIRATKIPQRPTTLAEKIVADADLEYLGTDLFYPISQNLYHEFRHFNPDLTLERFNEIQVKFIKKHRYHTAFCQTHREKKKQENLSDILESISGTG